ncbi:MAG TPA: hypothetical protein VHL81_09575 [Gemmatimonadales bacterium]|jgi:hypothetical protein|nr:hypothetical protein [Gemmatimonadales bacterium]
MTRRESGSRRRTRRSGERPRYEASAVYHLAQDVKSRGVDLGSALGPWRAGKRHIRRRGRASLHEVPVVTNERAVVMVDTTERASDVAGLLNWCGVHELDPVPELTPPPE